MACLRVCTLLIVCVIVVSSHPTTSEKKEYMPPIDFFPLHVSGSILPPGLNPFQPQHPQSNGGSHIPNQQPSDYPPVSGHGPSINFAPIHFPPIQIPPIQFPQIGFPHPQIPPMYPPVQQPPYPRPPVPSYPQPPMGWPQHGPHTGPHPGELDHQEMCELVMEDTKEMLVHLFGVEVNPLDFSVLHCMHRSELDQHLQVLQALSNIDLNFIAHHYPGRSRVPRNPILTCLGEAMYHEIRNILEHRPEDDAAYKLPVWCGREDNEMTPEQCEATLDSVAPSLPASTHDENDMPIDWRDVSFLDLMEPNELCHLIGVAKEHIGGAGHSSMLWNQAGIETVSRMIPPYRCYLGYLVYRIADKIQNELAHDQDVPMFCADVPPVDHLEGMAGDMIPEQPEEVHGEHVTRGLAGHSDAVKRSMAIMRAFQNLQVTRS